MIKKNITTYSSHSRPTSNHHNKQNQSTYHTTQKSSFQKTQKLSIRNNQYIVSEFQPDHKNSQKKLPINHQNQQLLINHQDQQLPINEYQHLQLIEKMSQNIANSGENTVALVNYLFEYIKEIDKDRSELKRCLEEVRSENRVMSNALHRQKMKNRIDSEQYARMMWEKTILAEKLQNLEGPRQQQTQNQGISNDHNAKKPWPSPKSRILSKQIYKNEGKVSPKVGKISPNCYQVHYEDSTFIL